VKSKNCFVIMPIGDQEVAGSKVPSSDLKKRYHVEYENSPSGLKSLAERLTGYFYHYSQNPDRPDNQLLEIAKTSNPSTADTILRALLKSGTLSFNDTKSNRPQKKQYPKRKGRKR